MVEQQLLSLHISCVSSTVTQTRINRATMNVIKMMLLPSVALSGIQGLLSWSRRCLDPAVTQVVSCLLLME